MAERLVARRPVVTVEAAASLARRDALAVEEPLEMRVDGEPLAVTMRTPGDDFALALGFCLGEGIVTDPAQVDAIRYCAGEPGPYTGDFNVVDVRRRPGDGAAPLTSRAVTTTSACGLCGAATIAAVRRQAPPWDGDPVTVEPAVLSALPAKVREAQRVFERTGGLHAAALATAEGDLRCVREDVGRHNAVDKVVGWAATQRLVPLRGHLLFVSGRVAFEIVQKALVAGIPVVAAVSAPTSLAVDLAQEAGMTLVGFLRGGRMNVYAGAWRLGL